MDQDHPFSELSDNDDLTRLLNENVHHQCPLHVINSMLYNPFKFIVILKTLPTVIPLKVFIHTKLPATIPSVTALT